MFKGSEGVDHPFTNLHARQKSRQQKKSTEPTKTRLRTSVLNITGPCVTGSITRFERSKRVSISTPDQMISLSSEIPFLEKLRSEVCRIPKKPNGNGLIQIMNKEEMKRLKIPSPNMATL